MAQIVYLHGFASIGTSVKSNALREKFGTENVYSPDFPVDPDMVESMNDTFMETNKNFPVIFVGTSLGGFWANYFAQKWDAPCVIVNPATQPSASLAKYIDAPVNKYYVGQITEVTPEILDGYAKREEWLKENTNGALISLFLAADDDIIPYTDTKAAIPHAALVAAMPTGGHRFETHWPLVVSRVAGMVN